MISDFLLISRPCIKVCKPRYHATTRSRPCAFSSRKMTVQTTRMIQLMQQAQRHPNPNPNLNNPLRLNKFCLIPGPNHVARWTPSLCSQELDGTEAIKSTPQHSGKGCSHSALRAYSRFGFMLFLECVFIPGHSFTHHYHVFYILNKHAYLYQDRRSFLLTPTYHVVINVCLFESSSPWTNLVYTYLCHRKCFLSDASSYLLHNSIVDT
jgi:hypothetical protein